MYSDALTARAEHTAGPATLARIDAATITCAPSSPTTRLAGAAANLALLALDGHDPSRPSRRGPTPWETPSTWPPSSTGGCPHRQGRRAERVGPLRWLAPPPTR